MAEGRIAATLFHRGVPPIGSMAKHTRPAGTRPGRGAPLLRWTLYEAAKCAAFEAADGWRYSLWANSRPATTKGWLGQNA